MASEHRSSSFTASSAKSASVIAPCPTPRDLALAYHSQARATWACLFAFTRKSHARVLILAFLSSAVTAILRTVLAVVLGYIFNVVAELGSGIRSGQSALEAVSKWCLVLVALGIGHYVSNTAFLALWIIFGELQADSARRGVFDSLLSKDMAWFDMLEQGVPGLLVRVQTQTRELQSATSQVFGFLTCDVLASAASIIIALYYSWKMTLLLCATLPPSLLLLSLATRQLDPAIKAQKATMETATRLTTASFAAIDLVKAFDGFDWEIRRYARALKHSRKYYLLQARCNSFQMGFVAFWVISLFILGFWLGILLVQTGLSPGDIVTTFYATLAAFQGVESLMPHWLVLSRGMSAGSFLSSLVADSGHSNPSAPGPQVCDGHVQFDNVTFAYPNNPTRTVLDSVSLSFPAGQLTFVVGESGSGKSTIGSLLTKLYKPYRGQILIDGHSIEALQDEWVRRHVTLIQQFSTIFDDTLFNNIALGHSNPTNVTAEQIHDACQTALLQSTIASLPQGLDTRVGSKGFELSGGQKQKVALARAKLRDSSILILDEITSGLDQVGRSLVMDAIRKWRRGKTTIVVTHEVSEIRENEYVYIVDHATVVKQGFKGELLELRDSTPATPLSPGVSGRAKTMARESLDPHVFVVKSKRHAHHKRASGLRPSSRTLLDLLRGTTPASLQPMERANHNLSTVEGKGSTKSQGLGERMVPSSVWPSGQRLTLVIESESRRFSAFINSKFFPLHEKNDKVQDEPYGPESRHSVLEEDLYSPQIFGREGDDFVFGAAERRTDIPGLRLTCSNVESRTAENAQQLSPTDTTTDHASLVQIFCSVWPALGPRQRLLLVLGISVCLVGAAATPSFAFCLARLMSVIWMPGDKAAEGGKWAGYLAIIAVVDGLCTGAGHYMLETVAQHWVDGIRVKAARGILQQPMSWFGDMNHSPGRVSECLERNAEEMRNVVGRFVPMIVFAFTIMMTSLIWALAISWRLTLVTLAPIPLVIATVRGYVSISGKWETRCNEGAEEASAVLTEIIGNIRLVQTLNLEQHFTQKYRQSAKEVLRLGLKRARNSSWLFGLYQSTSFAMTALVFYYSTKLLSTEAASSVTSILQVVNLLLFSIGTSAEILNGVPQLTTAQSAAAPLLRYSGLPSRPGADSGRMKVMAHSPLPVRIRDVNFSYSHRSAEAVLRGVSFDIEPGKCTVLVGHSGCGKSTLLSLLLGLHSPSVPPDRDKHPPLSFGGVSFLDVDKQHLRSMMAYVPQSPFLFPGSISENILYGADSPHRVWENVMHAAQAAGLHDFVASLPLGYDTPVGEGGLALSGGQAQRLSIARALARHPRLLVMDEPTSALDADSARAVCRAVTQLVRRARRSPRAMAVILATHSHDAMRLADRIVVLSGGVKVDEGSYEALVRRRGPFRDLVSGGQWAGGDESDFA